jgi:NADH/NAD ratio-sensing transcriptional regulator Rex
MKNTKPPFTRRQFIKTTGTAAIGAPIIMQSSFLNGQNVAPSDRINLGVIGCGGLGNASLNACASQPNVVITAACDVWKERLDPVVEKFKDTCTGFTDFREMLLKKDLDAVIIATPAHWHAIIAIAACEAGKDIYHAPG